MYRYDSNFEEFSNFARILGLLEQDNVTTKVNGKDVKVNDLAYTLLQNIFIKDKSLKFNEMHMNLSGLRKEEYNQALLKFMCNKTNCADMLNNIKNLPRIYDWFKARTNMEITGTHQINDGIPTIEENRFKVYHYAEREDGSHKEKWSAPTYKLIMEGKLYS